MAAERGEWSTPESVDAVVAYNTPLDDGLLHSALASLRPGGRLIIVDPGGTPDESFVQTLEGADFPGARFPQGSGQVLGSEHFIFGPWRRGRPTCAGGSQRTGSP